MTLTKATRKIALLAALLAALTLLALSALGAGAEEAPKYTITTKRPMDRLENFRYPVGGGPG